MPEPDLSRFLAAQDDVYPQVLGELQACRKTSHWMWFVFPQIAGLGQSDMARRYAIADLAEAAAYLSHPVLAQRLRAVTSLMVACDAASARQVLGAPDDMKFRSCLTLFQAAAASAEDEALFTAALKRFFEAPPIRRPCRSSPRRSDRPPSHLQTGAHEPRNLTGMSRFHRAEDAPD